MIDRILTTFFQHHSNKLASFLLTIFLFECNNGMPENLGVDPCNFPTPFDFNFPALCRYHYHQSKFVCDPLALLSRTEAEILNKRFNNYSLSGCVDCKTNTKRGCVPSYSDSNARVSIIILPYSNTQR